MSASELTPMENVQRLLRDAANMTLDSPGTEEFTDQLQSLINEMLDGVEGKKVELLQQWLYCYNTYVRHQDGSRRSDLAIAMQGMLTKFKLEQRDIAYAFYPLLDTKDEDLHDLLVKFMGRNDKTRDGRRDFGVYEEIIEAELEVSNNVPEGLIKYLYEKAPAVALLTMTKLEGRGFERLRSELLSAQEGQGWPPSNYRKLKLRDEHDRKVIVTELEKLSQRSEWWIQYFVGEFVAQVPEVGTVAVRDNLSGSENLLVKQLLANPDKYKK